MDSQQFEWNRRRASTLDEEITGDNEALEISVINFVEFDFREKFVFVDEALVDGGF